MFNNVALDVFIGLITVILLYSLLASIVMETLAKYLGLRARITALAIFKILDDSSFKSTNNRYKRLINRININNLTDKHFTALFYAHPNIKNLGKNDLFRKPSSISPELFSETVIQILRGDAYDGQQKQIDAIKSNLKIGQGANEGQLQLPSWYSNTQNTYKLLPASCTAYIQINPLTIYQLKQLLFDSNSDVDVFRKKLILWFNEMMERANGWYTKLTRLYLFFIGLAIAIVCNVDAINIAQKLSTDKAARDKMIEFAGKIQSDKTLNLSGAALNESSDAITNAFKKVNKNISEASLIISAGDPFDGNWGHIPGYLLMAMAISLGAPFWFDLLSKIMAIRQSGSEKKDGKEKTDNQNNSSAEQPIG